MTIRTINSINTTHAFTCLKCLHLNWLTFCPDGNPGSQTARDSSLTKRSWTCPMLSPTLSKPSCSMPKVGTSTFKSRPKTFPKPRRNCISIKQSETARPGRISPGIRENSGRGWTKKRIKQVSLFAVCVTPRETIHILFL